MIPAGVEIYVALDPIDLRCGFNKLSGFVREKLSGDPRSGALFVFFGKRRHAVKILFWDGTGLCLFYKRLDARIFRGLEATRPEQSHLELNEMELDALLDGIDIEKKKGRSIILH
jgi:transposase